MLQTERDTVRTSVSLDDALGGFDGARSVQQQQQLSDHSERDGSSRHAPTSLYPVGVLAVVSA